MKDETWEERQIREKQFRETFFIKMQSVANFLGWIYQPFEDNRDGCYLKSGYQNNEAKIWTQLDMWHKDKERIVLRGCYPNGNGSIYRTKSFEITVSAIKDALKIAKDIENRLLPDYLVELDNIQEQIRRHNEFEAKQKAMMEKIGNYLGVQVHENGNIYPNNIKFVYQIKRYGEEEVEFEVKCSPELAIKILDLLK